MNNHHKERFSIRHGFSKPKQGKLIRHEAPDSLRCGLLQILQGEMKIVPEWIRQVVCKVLRVRPSNDNWSNYPNIWDEVQGLVHACDWYRIYEIIEEVYSALLNTNVEIEFEKRINNLFSEEGIGWQLIKGELKVCGNEPFEDVLNKAAEQLNESGLTIATSELHEAIKDLSRRPESDLSGSLHHAMAALECVAREVTGDQNATLGEIIKNHPDMFPKPIDDAVAKLWGYSSEQARHARENRDLSWEEAQLIVGIAAVLCSYLTQKIS